MVQRDLYRHLADACDTLPADALTSCAEFVLFPLLVLLDSLLAARHEPPGPSTKAASTAGTPPSNSVPAVFAAAMRADRAAEVLLDTVCRMLRRCGRGTSPPALPLLQRLSPLVQLRRGQASEEVRLLGLRCMEAALALVDAQQAHTLCSEAVAPLLGSIIAGLLRCVVFDQWRV